MEKEEELEKGYEMLKEVLWEGGNGGGGEGEGVIGWGWRGLGGILLVGFMMVV